MGNKQAAALALVNMGFRVFPIAEGGKAPPLLRDWPAKATDDADVVRVLWGKWPAANVGIHCAGLVVLDVDVAKGGADTAGFLDLQFGLPPTLTTETPSGGRHLFYRLPAEHPGAANSVQVLGPGLDVRGQNGYVLAPGSETPAGRYKFLADVPIADAPEWLVRKLATVVAKKATPDAPVAEAPDAILEAARGWLAAQDGAIEGQGGDAYTFTVACGLRDRGVSESQAVELLTDWNARCEPPWTPAEIEAKVGNAYRYAQNDAGARVALPSDFPAVDVPPEPPKAPRPGPQRLTAFAAGASKGPGYLVKGLLNRRSHAVMYGAPGEGKTFVALDLAYHVAAGKPWMDRKVHAGPVLYLAYEGTGGMRKRAQAILQKHGQTDIPLYIHAADYNLREQAGRKALGVTLAELPEKPVLIVLDTLARALKGGDENSAQDMGALNDAVGALVESTGACVLLIHHSGKNKNAGARGSSALLGAIDTELEVEGKAVHARKQRDVELCESIGFKLHPLVVGVDDDGDEITSCVVEGAPVEYGSSGRTLSGNPKRGFEALCILRPDNSPVSNAEWLSACEAFLPQKGVRQRFYDMKQSLLDKGLVVLDPSGGYIRRLE